MHIGRLESLTIAIGQVEPKSVKDGIFVAATACSIAFSCRLSEKDVSLTQTHFKAHISQRQYGGLVGAAGLGALLISMHTAYVLSCYANALTKQIFKLLTLTSTMFRPHSFPPHFTSSILRETSTLACGFLFLPPT